MKKLLAVLCILTFLLPGCGTVPEETTAPQIATLPTETTTPIQQEATSPPETTLPVDTNSISETELYDPEVPEETIPFDYSEPYLSIYLVKWDPWPYRYYIAPMGTEDWVELCNTGLSCGSESMSHAHNACAKYTIPIEMLDEGLWRVKRETDMELWQDWFGDWDRAPETIYYENVSVYDGILWNFSYDELLTQDMAYCDNCPEEFRARYTPDA